MGELLDGILNSVFETAETVFGFFDQTNTSVEISQEGRSVNSNPVTNSSVTNRTSRRDPDGPPDVPLSGLHFILLILLTSIGILLKRNRLRF